jgi:hypothetical protein
MRTAWLFPLMKSRVFFDTTGVPSLESYLYIRDDIHHGEVCQWAVPKSLSGSAREKWRKKRILAIVHGREGLTVMACSVSVERGADAPHLRGYQQ